MISLHEYITEAGFNIGVGFTEEQALAQFQIIKKNLDKSDIEGLDQITGFLYGLWNTDHENTPQMIPYRFGNRSVKIARIYEVIKEDLFDFLRRKNIKFKITKKGFSCCGITFEWGDGSMFVNRSGKGLDYEDTIIKELITLVQTIGGAHKEKKLSKTDLANIVEDKSLHHLFPLYLEGALDEVLDMFIKDPGIDLSTVIVKTGDSNTQRNRKGQLFDKDFNITESDMKAVLDESGYIISDVTINTAHKVYISVKMKSSQLSGINYQWALEKNDAMWKGIADGKTFDDVKDAPDMKALINFCNVVGIDVVDIYDKYTKIVNQEKIDKEIKLGKHYDGKKLGILFQKLIGGNYWYTKPDKVLFVPAENKHWAFDIDRATMADSGKRISIRGRINGIDVELEFRTDGHGLWPYRLFPRTDVPALINTME